MRSLILSRIRTSTFLALILISGFAHGQDQAPGIATLSDAEIEETTKLDDGIPNFADDLLPPIDPGPDSSEKPGSSLLSDPDLEVGSIPLESEAEEPEFDMYLFNSGRYDSYRSAETMYSYLPGNGDNFGWIDLQSSPYIAREAKNGLTSAINLHLLAGPDSTPIPPRLWDFIIGYQYRGDLSDRFSYDLAANIGVFSDFEDSARDGIRFPSHAVGMLHFNPGTDFVFGVDYLDWDDLALLPVVGFSFHPQDHPRFRLDLVFPRPRMDVVIDCKRRMYLAAFLDGGTWDIERPDETNDVMTYRDYRAVFGFEHADKCGGLSSIEAGYVFDRQLLFRTVHTVTDFNDAFVIRMAWRH